MMMPSTMIFTICISMILKRNRGLLDRDWGGRSRPPRQKFLVTSVGVIFNQWGVKYNSGE